MSILTLGSIVIPSSTVFASEQIIAKSSVNSTMYKYSNTTYDSNTNTTTVTITDQ